MNRLEPWLAAWSTLALLLGYEIFLGWRGRRAPERIAMTAHAALRTRWLAALSAQPGSEILGVQTLRNALSSASMTASTAALGLMGAVTLASPSLLARFTGEPRAAALAAAPFTPRLLIEIALLVQLFAALVSAAMAVRYYNHASFIVALPVGSELRRHWSRRGARYLRRAGLLYSYSLRYLMLVAPLLVCLLQPVAGPVAAIVAIAVLYAFDRAGAG